MIEKLKQDEIFLEGLVGASFREIDIAEAAEYKKSLDIAKNMVSDNVPIDIISQYTGLPSEVINQLI